MLNHPRYVDRCHLSRLDGMLSNQGNDNCTLWSLYDYSMGER